MKAWPLVVLLVAGCNTGPPDRDVFTPPYAEKGCWARLYAAADFAGPMRQLEGPVFVEAIGASPVHLPGLDIAAPQPQFGELRSLLVGPHARIVGYEEKLFRRPVLELAPGTRLADVASVKFRERVQSMRMDCIA